MRSFALIGAVLGVLGGTGSLEARAGVADDVKRTFDDFVRLGGRGERPRFAFHGGKVIVPPAQMADESDTVQHKAIWREVIGVSADSKVAWIAADEAEVEVGCGMAPCPPPPPPPEAEVHATVLYEKSGRAWLPVAWHIADVTTAKQQIAGIKDGTAPDQLERKVDAGAEDVVAVFEASIGDPRALAKTVSDRKEVVLYGSEPRERTVGGAKVRSKLEAWRLGFRVRDGVQAGLTSNHAVAWVAANLDAISQKKPTDKPVPYRVLFLYEKAGAGWKLVQAHFSFATGS